MASDDLQSRIAAATPQDTVRGLIFNALFGVLAERLGEAGAASLDPDGKGRRPDLFSYPVADFLRIAFAGAARLAPALGSEDAAFRAFGHRAASNVFGSVIGATMLALAGRNGLRALLGQAATGYRATVSYGVRTLEWRGARHARFTFTRDFLVPAFHCGVFAGAVDAAGARAVQIEGRATGPLAAEYDVIWSDPAPARGR